MEDSYLITPREIESLLIELRGQRVMLDRDVAHVYGVETRRVNEAVKNNTEKFPENYCFRLQPSEKQYVVENFDNLRNLDKSPVEPRAFTERRLYMIATILKSKKATETTFSIIETFAKSREITRNIHALHQEPDNSRQQGLIRRTGELLSDIIVDEADTMETESSIELNLMAIKFKHVVKKTKK
ncbi:MAG: ORF6N domain-containing protein [Prevotella sp.]|nr:ORF6N domain-containing protein [Prevotella sp.]